MQGTSRTTIGWCNSPLSSTNPNTNSNSISNKTIRIKVISNLTNNNKCKITSEICSLIKMDTTQRYFPSSASVGQSSITTERYSSMPTVARSCSTPMECWSSHLCSSSTRRDRHSSRPKAPSCAWTYWRYLDPFQLTSNSTSISTTKSDSQAQRPGLFWTGPTRYTISSSSSILLRCSRRSLNLKWDKMYRWKKKNTLVHKSRTMPNTRRKVLCVDTAGSHSLLNRSNQAMWICSWQRAASIGSMSPASDDTQPSRCQKDKKLVTRLYLKKSDAWSVNKKLVKPSRGTISGSKNSTNLKKIRWSSWLS